MVSLRSEKWKRALCYGEEWGLGSDGIGIECLESGNWMGTGE